MFGPTVGGELALGEYSAGLFGRWLDGGMLARTMFPDDDSGEKFAFSYGVGVRGRRYFQPGLSGLSLGLVVELLQSRTESDTLLLATNVTLVVPQVEAGYRMKFGTLLVGGTLGLGYALPVASSVEDLPGGSIAALVEVKDVSNFYGSVGLEVGVFF